MGSLPMTRRKRGRMRSDLTRRDLFTRRKKTVTFARRPTLTTKATVRGGVTHYKYHAAQDRPVLVAGLVLLRESKHGGRQRKQETRARCVPEDGQRKSTSDLPRVSVPSLCMPGSKLNCLRNFMSHSKYTKSLLLHLQHAARSARPPTRLLIITPNNTNPNIQTKKSRFRKQPQGCLFTASASLRYPFSFFLINFFLSSYSLSHSHHQPINPLTHIPQIRLIPAIQFRNHAPRITNLRKRLPHRRPIHVPIAQVHPSVSILFPLEVLQMHLVNTLSQSPNPILRIPVEHHIPHIKPRLDPRTLKLTRYTSPSPTDSARNLFHTSSIAITTFNSAASGISLRISACDRVQASR